MRRVIPPLLLVLVLAGGGALVWRALKPAPPPEAVPLDQRPYAQTTDKEREDWMRKLGYVD